MKSQNPHEWTGERYLPEIKGSIALEHLHRYALACQFATGKNVLDIASGEGYGSMMLAKVAKRVIGVDISKETIIYAAERYGTENLDFSAGSCDAIPLKDSSMDLIVSFETIEHHDQHVTMLEEFRRILGPCGLLIVSSPDKHEYSDVPNYRNPFHVKELYRHEFESLLSGYFGNIQVYGQRVIYGSGIFIEKGPASYLNFNFDAAENVINENESLSRPVYNIVIASNGDLPETVSSVLEEPIWKSDIVKELTQELSDTAKQHKTAIADQAKQIIGLRKKLTEKDTEIENLSTQLADQDSVIKGFLTQLADRDSVIEELQHLMTLSKNEIDHIYDSKSWKLIKLFRFIRRNLISIPNRLLRQYLSNSVRLVWYHLPLRMESKLALKGRLFKTFSFIFKHTAAYRAWQAFAGETTDFKQNIALSTDLPKMISGWVRDEKELPVPLLDKDPIKAVPVRVIAFYLPQFHPIPENDEWWGSGFTEWTNVKRATPQFAGHYQPHVPGELGYYDLRNAKVQRRQVELAKLYGIGGFCFHFYWFGGKRLLERPIEQYLDNRDLDLPFCLCWANENWSRRWDGAENQILIAQNYSPEDDLAFIEYISKYLKDPRYIRIQGKPLLIVYRPGLLPSAKKTAKLWRNWCLENDIGELYLAYAQSFESIHPRKIDFDAAIEFPPNNSNPPVITEQVKSVDPDFSGIIYDWNIFLERSQKYRNPGYPVFRSVCPAWDNTARRMNRAAFFLGSTPSKYGYWLENAALDTVSRFPNQSERLVFVNAWNEWAEGAHLEPDTKYGYGYLQSTRDALERVNAKLSQRRIVLVAHDAHPHGAQNLILHMAKILAEDLGFAVDMIVLGDGPLLEQYGRYATIHKISMKDAGGKKGRSLAAGLFGDGVHSAIANTTVAGHFTKTLKNYGFTVITLIHELPGVIKQFKLQSHVKSIAKHADWIVFPSKKVREGFEQFAEVPLQRVNIRPQGLFRKNSLRNSGQIKKARKKLRSNFRLPETAHVVLCVGYADRRKGVDLFVDIGLRLLIENKNAYFIWVGHFDPEMELHINKTIQRTEFRDHFIFPGKDFKTDHYYAGADIYALTSREDPFPSVVLEALDANLPIVAFDGVGGFAELLSRGGGILVPAFETDAFSKAVLNLLSKPKEAHAIGVTGSRIVKREFSFRRYVFDLLKLADAPIKRVSVIVPNFNYARYLADRIKSIADQEYPIYEIIILDDVSTDGSIALIEKAISKLPIDCELIVNESNSGNPFVQWLKGVKLARGDYVWIAEADDLAEPGFLFEVLRAFEDPSIVMSYCQSKQMDSEGRILCADYLGYVSDVSPNKWTEYYVEEGLEEIRTSLAIKNTVPNVSAVVFERNALLHSLKEKINEIKQYSVAGDWLTYIHVMKQGKIAYSPKPFNLHRRHQNSITLGSFNLMQLEEIMAIQQMVRQKFDPKNDIVKKANTYAERLYEQFELSSPDAPMISKHPRLSSYFEF